MKSRPGFILSGSSEPRRTPAEGTGLVSQFFGQKKSRRFWEQVSGRELLADVAIAPDKIIPNETMFALSAPSQQRQKPQMSGGVDLLISIWLKEKVLH